MNLASLRKSVMMVDHKEAMTVLPSRVHLADLCGCRVVTGDFSKLRIGYTAKKELVAERCGGIPITKAKGTPAERILALTSKWSNRIERAFKRSMAALKENVDVEAISSALESGNRQKAYDLVDEALSSHGFKALRQEFNNAVIAGATLGATLGHESIFTGGGPSAVQFTFDVANPKTVDFLSRYAADQVTELTDTARRVVRSVLADGFAAGDNPLTVARDVRNFIGLTDYQAQIVSNFRTLITDGTRPDGSDATVADYLSRDLRDRRFDSLVSDFLDGTGDPLSADKIDTIVDRYATRWLNMRADTIGRTEGIRAVSAGNLQVWEQAVEDGKIPPDMEVRRFWVFTDDDKVREAHTEIPDMNPDGVGIDEPFDTPEGPLMYPGDPDGEPANTINCRCVVLYELRPTGE